MANDDDDEVLIRALRGEPTLEENADEEVVKSRLKKIMSRGPVSADKAEIWDALMDEMVVHPANLSKEHLFLLKMWFDETLEELMRPSRS
jgi:hypothetical protein